MLAALFKGPAPYVPRSRWPAWAVLPAGVAIFVLAVVLGGLLTYVYVRLTGAGVPHAIDPAHPPHASDAATCYLDRRPAGRAHRAHDHRGGLLLL